MVKFNRDDLQFILDQIKISEAHAGGTPLTDLVPNPLLPWGVRTVDGTLNNIIPGRETWGSADQPFPRLTDPSFRTGTADPDFDINGPFAPGGTGQSANYAGTGTVVDTAPRTISNLVVDQTLNNPAAIMAALEYAGITGSAATAARNLIVQQYQAIEPLVGAAQAAAAAELSAQNLLSAAITARDAALLADAAAQATVAAYDAAIAEAPAASTSAATAQNAVTNFLTLLAIGNPADATDMALLAAAIAAAQQAAAESADVLAALAAGPNVTAADLAGAQSRAADTALLVTQLTDLQTTLQADPNVDITVLNAAGTAAALATNNALAASGVAASLDDPDSRDAAVVAAADAATALADAEALVVTRQGEYDDAVIASDAADAALDSGRTTLDATLAANSIELSDNGTISIPNVAPDEGISAPFNSWMTLFGQFFDHGLDLVEKTSSSKVYIPLQPDDPLYDPAHPETNFMVITRTTADARNLTTPFVDQNQTYTSHASHQVFLREYAKWDHDGNAGTPDRAIATGHLLEGDNGGLATWADIKAQAAEMLGLTLDDRHIHEVPLLATDLYGMFERAPNGYAQVMVTVSLTGGGTITAKASGKDGGLDLRNITAADLVAGSLPVGFNPADVTGITALGTGHAFLDDIAHDAAPAFVDPDRNPGTPDSQWTTADTDSDTGNAQPLNGVGVRLTYDDELLDRHFITGDGRGNENIGLTAVHHVFHSEHNRLAEHTKDVTIATGDLAFVNEWLLTAIDQATLDAINAETDPVAKDAAIDALQWNGERLFQAARFGTEMQYQHLVFEEFARKVNPMVDLFVFNPTMDIDPAIFAEFAHVVYRFGHSMLNETVDRLAADGQTRDDIGLIEAFLNPVEFDKDGSVTADQAAGAIVRAMTRQQGNEIDEFVTEALRNNLLGLPLDLATINLARGRETGMPTLQEARAEFYEMTRSEWLKPYTNWVDFAQHLKNPASVINFIAAYGTHASIASATTLDDKRAAATKIVLGDGTLTGQAAADFNDDRLDFLNARDAYAGDARLGGLNDVDLWIGGLAEAILPFGGMLGSTFTFVFEAQLERLQNGDRFYYLSRTQGLHFLQELENNAFSKLIMANTDLGAADATHLPGEVFSTPQHILEIDISKQAEPDPQHEDEVLQGMEPKVVRDGHLVVDGNTYDRSLKFTGGEHVVLGGSEQDDVLIADLGDDTIWGDGGNDYIEGGHGINRLHGGTGDDIIYGGGDAEFIHGDEGNDVINAGNGLGDLVFGGAGHDFVLAGIDGTEVFGAEGNDFILGTPDVDFLLGGEGDDWIEGGEGFDTLAGENSQLFFNSSIIGHDVLIAGTNENDFDAESGDDIMVQGESVMRNEGMLGFDWAIFKGVSFGADADLRVPIFTTVVNDILRNRFDRTEALSGWKHDDRLSGDDRVAAGGPVNPAIPANEQTLEGDELNREGVERIAGLADVVGVTQAQLDQLAPTATVFNGGNILLGGGGSDTLQGNGGNDILDGDRWLNVRIGIVDGNGVEIGTADGMQGAVTFNANADAALLARNGAPLDELMFDRTINPGDLRIVREVLDGAETGDIDVAVFRGNQAEYTITDLGNGSWQVAHTAPAEPQFDDGTDIVRNVEFLRFADQVVNVGGVANSLPTGNLALTITQGPGNPAALDLLDTLTVSLADPDGAGPLNAVADADGLPPISAFTFTWQVETAPGSGVFANLINPLTGALVQGTSFQPTPTFEIEDGVRLRVVGSYIDGHGVPESVFSQATAPMAGLVPDPAAVLGLDLTVAPNNVGPDGVPVDPANFAGPVRGIFEDLVDNDPGTAITAFTFTRADLLANVTIPTAGLVVRNVELRVPDGDQPAGILTETAPDTWSFDPAENFNGGVTFTFEIVDTQGGVTPAEATLEVVAVNDAPVPAPLQLGVINAGAAQTLTFTDAQLFGTMATDANGRPIDIDGDRVSIVAGSVTLANPAQGTLTDNLDGTYTFVPAAGVFGDIAVNFTLTDDIANVVGSTSLVVGRTFDGGGGADVQSGTIAGDVLNGGGGNDVLTGLAGNDAINGGGGNDTAVFASSVRAATFATAGLLGGDTQVTTAAEGVDTLNGIETLRFAGVDYGLVRATGLIINNPAGANTLNGGNGADLVLGFGGNDTLNGNNGGDALVGGTGNDTVNGGAGNDTVLWNAGDGRDRISGGADTDTVVVNGDASDEVFRIYTRTEAIAQGVATAPQLLGTTEIVITRNGTNNAAIITELGGVEEIVINGNGGANSFETHGDFTGTSLALNTITIHGSEGDDTVDITGLLSSHRIVFHSKGGSDTIVGTLRPQDRIIMPEGTDIAHVQSQSNGDGTTTFAFGGTSVTVAAGSAPAFVVGNGTEHVPDLSHPALADGFAFSAADLAALKNLVNGQPATAEHEPGTGGVRDLEGTGNNLAKPNFGSADQPFIRITDAHFGAYDPATGNRAINPIFDGLDPRAISNALGAQEAGLAKNASDANIFFMAFGQYVDHGLDFVPKGGNGTIAIGGPGMSVAGDNPADLTRATVTSFDADGVPRNLNKTSPYVDQNQAYGSNELVGQFLRETDGEGGIGARLMSGATDPSNAAFRLLPTLRELILEHWENNTVFHHESLPGGSVAFRDCYPGLVDGSGAIDAGIAAGLNADFMGSGFSLVGDANPFVNILDHFVAGDLRANENVALTSIHTVWARNHNYHVEKLVASGFEGTAEELFQAAKIVNEAEYQRTVFGEFVDYLIGGLKGSGSHGHDEYNPTVDASISHEFASAVYRVGHSLIGQTMTVLDADGEPRQVPLVDLFLNPTNAAPAFTAPLPPGYVPQPGFHELGVNAILGGIVGQQAEEVDFNLVDAVRNDLVRIRADLFAFNVARGWDVGLGTLNQVRASLLASADPYVSEAVHLSGADLSPYKSWADFQARNGLSDAVIEQFKQAYPDLVLASTDEIAAFRAANPDIELVGGNTVKGIDRVDLWVGGLAETHINGGMVGGTFWVVLHEQFDRLQEGDRFYYTDRVGDLEFYETLKELKLSDIVARNTGIEGLDGDIFRSRALDADDGVPQGGDTGTDAGDGDGAGQGSGDDDGDGDGDTAGNGGGNTGNTGTTPAGLHLVGTAGGDALLGGAGNDWAVGGDGEDTLLLGDGENTGVGGDGDDIIAGGAHRDMLVGGEGSDKLFAHGGDDALYGEDGDDVLDAGAGNDVIDGGKGDDRIDAGAGNDTIIASRGDGHDVVDGGAGTDTLDLAAITDALTIDLGATAQSFGFARSTENGNDVIRGIENVVSGQGNDTIFAGHGVNVLAGGFGNDTFVFRSIGEANGDKVVDFHAGDRIDVSAIAQHFGLENNQFTLSEGPIAAKGQLVFRVEDHPEGQVTVIEGNVDDNAAPDFRIEIEGAHRLDQDDFFGARTAA